LSAANTITSGGGLRNAVHELERVARGGCDTGGVGGVLLGVAASDAAR
jgi:hypothetical protein